MEQKHTDNSGAEGSETAHSRRQAVPGLRKTGTWLREELGSSKITRKLFGKAPWHRKVSIETVSSVSSSVREVLQGDTPPGTPIPDYTMACKQANSFE